jgi:type IV pilus assembly protein PilO
MKLSEIDIKDIDFQRMGAWPSALRYIVSFIVVLIIFLIGWFWQIQPKREELQMQQAKEGELLQIFQVKQNKVANLEKIKEQVADIRGTLRVMREKLPSKTEMAGLLKDVSQAALSSGLDNQKFEPSPSENMKEFYAERLINLRMLGTYDQFGGFASAIAGNQRVIALGLRDVSLKPVQEEVKGQPATNKLLLEGMVITYRYLDDDEIAQQQAQAATSDATGGAVQ